MKISHFVHGVMTSMKLHKKTLLSIIIGFFSQFLSIAAANAMPPIPDESASAKELNILIEQQTAAYNSGKYSKALIANNKIRARLAMKGFSIDLRKHSQTVTLFAAKANIDKSLILYKLGRSKEAIALMKRLQADGSVDKLLTEYRAITNDQLHFKIPYLVYYTSINHAYLEWLNETKDPSLGAVAKRLWKDLESVRNIGPPPVANAGVVSYLLNLHKDSGDLKAAKAICDSNIKWLESISSTAYQYNLGSRQTVFANDDYVYDWAFKIADFGKERNYALAEGYDDCAGLMEQSGETETALDYRLRSRPLIIDSDEKKFTGLIDMRIGRLPTYLGRPEEAAPYLQRAWKGGDDVPVVQAVNSRATLCERLSFNWKGAPQSKAAVKAKWASHPATAIFADIYYCGGSADRISRVKYNYSPSSQNS